MSNYQELYKKYRPKTWDDIKGQNNVVNSLRSEVMENRLPTGYLFCGGHGTGKALHKETLIPTPKGFTKMGDLKVGDFVLGLSGKPTKVLAIYHPKDKNHYELTFSNGGVVKAAGNHLWKLECEEVLNTDILYTKFSKGETITLPKRTGPALRVHQKSMTSENAFSAGVIYALDDNLESIPKEDLQELLQINIKDLPDEILKENYDPYPDLIVATLDEIQDFLLGFSWAAGEYSEDGKKLLFKSAKKEKLDTIVKLFNLLGFPIPEVLYSLTLKKAEVKPATSPYEVVNECFEISVPESFLYSGKRKNVLEIHPKNYGNIELSFIQKINDTPEDYLCITVDAEDSLFLCTEYYIPTHNTSTARVLAKAINCEHLDERGNPCNKCPSCLGIENNSQLGFQYISLANHGSADEVRKITQDAMLRQPIKKQVWVLDECHNLSAQAFDALLIPLESENMPSLFVFCSTEPEKIRKTVLSRLKVRNFAPIRKEVLLDELSKINDLELLGLSKDVIMTAVNRARGSFRDAIQYMEEFSDTGVIPESYLDKALATIQKRDIAGLYELSRAISEDTGDYLGVMLGVYKQTFNSLYGAMLKESPDTIRNFYLQVMETLGEGITLLSGRNIDGAVIFELTMLKIFKIVPEIV